MTKKTQAWGVFLAYYLSHVTFIGATHLQYALIGGLTLSQAMIISPMIATTNRRLGTQVTLILGSVLVFGSLIGSSFARQTWQLFLSQGVCMGWGMGFLYITSTAILPQWFTSRRSLAMGLASSGAGLGGLVYNLLSGYLIENIGLRQTFRVLAFCSLGANLISSLLLKDWNMSFRIHERVFDFRAYGRLEIMLLIVWGVLTELGYVTLLYSLPNYASYIGLTPRQGSVVGAMLNLGLGFGRPIVGYFSDKFGRINVATLMTALCGMLCFVLWIPAKSYGCLLTFGILAGTVCGTFWGTIGPVAAEVVGMRKLSSVFGLICFSLVLPTTFAEPIALEIVSSSGYLVSQIVVGCFFILGALSTWLLRSWKIRDDEAQIQLEHIPQQAARTNTVSALHSFAYMTRNLFSKRKV